MLQVSVRFGAFRLKAYREYRLLEFHNLGATLLGAWAEGFRSSAAFLRFQDVMM